MAGHHEIDTPRPKEPGSGRGTVPEPMRLPTGPTSCKLSFATARADAQAHRQAVCTNGTLPLPGSTSAGEVRVADDVHRIPVGCAGDRAGRRRWSRRDAHVPRNFSRLTVLV